MPIDFERINAEALARYPDLLHQWLPGGRLAGREYKCADICGGKGESLSVNTSTGKWSDFAADAGGRDPISLYAAIRHLSQGDAAKELGDDFGCGAPGYSPPPPREKPAEAGEWEPVYPVPDTAPAPPEVFKTKKQGTWVEWPVTRRWAYHDAEGRLIGYVCRFDHPDGSKDVIPQTWCRSTSGQEKWKWHSFTIPRPLYGLDRLAARPAANVIVVEGEKCADALQEMFPDFVVVSWPGGGKAVHYSDLSPLNGRKVLFWPDFDSKTYPPNHTLGGQIMPYHEQPGPAAMLKINRNIGALLNDERILTYTPGGEFPDGWDCYDAIAGGMGREDVLAFIKSRMVHPGEVPTEIADPVPLPPEPEEPPEPSALEPPPLDDADQEPAGEWPSSAPFRVLGYDHGSYFYLPVGSRQVQELTAPAHADKNLLTLARLQWWERAFPGKQGPTWMQAANALFRQAEQVGVYRPDRVRGRGAWEDAGRSVLHLGDRLVIDGRAVGIHEIETNFIYEAAPPLNQVGMDASPLETSAAINFMRLCEMLSWESPIFAKLLAGWCIIAPICGSLPWRPHLWLTGPARSGKSWVVKNILHQSIGPAALMVQSNTTEAGLRQRLKHDALPVVFDEAEGEEKEDQKRVQHVLELMRQASSETGGSILKGSTSGQAQTFTIRSCFAFSSIAVRLKQKADISRVTVLQLTKNPNGREDFERIKEFWRRHMSEEFCSGLRTRTVRLLPVIVRNARTFGDAVADFMGDQRAGDQLGTLLAGAYSLHSGAAIEPQAAREWVRAQEWGDLADHADDEDQDRCLSVILEAIIRTQGDKSAHDLTIGELVRLAVAPARIRGDLSPQVARETLCRYGIRVQQDATEFLVANRNENLRRILRETPWGEGWARMLDRVEGAEKRGSTRFAGQGVQKAVAIPIRHAPEVEK
jgi:putative DNA primase/helicase